MICIEKGHSLRLDRFKESKLHGTSLVFDISGTIDKIPYLNGIIHGNEVFVDADNSLPL